MGSIVNTDRLNALRTTIDAKWLKAYLSPRELIWKMLCTEIPSSSRSVVLPILDMIPEMREWLGDRVINNVAKHSVEIANKHFELTMGVNVDDINDEEYAGAELAADGLGMAANKHPDKLLATLLKDGEINTCFDGQYFFDTDHPTDAKNGTGTAQSNYSASGCALTAANWELVRGRMAGFRGGPDGRIIGVRPNLLVVPTQLGPTARRIVEADKDQYGADNVNKGTAKVVEYDELNDEATGWYAIDARDLARPFGVSMRERAKLVMMNSPNSQGVFEKNLAMFGVDGRWNVGYGAWFRAYKAVA